MAQDPLYMRLRAVRKTQTALTYLFKTLKYDHLLLQRSFYSLFLQAIYTLCNILYRSITGSWTLQPSMDTGKPVSYFKWVPVFGPFPPCSGMVRDADY